jgi:biopolymer transport protein ExbB
MAMVVLLGIPSGPARGQDDAGFDIDGPADRSGARADPEETGSAERRAPGGSLVSAFFVSYQTDPVSGEESVELLGSMIIWLLLFLSVLSIGLMGNLAMANRRRTIVPQGVLEEVTRLIRGGKFREVLDLTSVDRSFYSQVLHAGLSEASHGFSAVLRALEQSSEEMTTGRLRRVEYLNVLGQVSPMIGLFGTVYGMILAFQAIVLTGGNADPILLAGGISTALVTTFWGLIVAIPALAAYAIIRNRIDEFTTEATLHAEEMLNQFRPRPSARQNKLAAEERPERPTPRPAPQA